MLLGLTKFKCDLQHIIQKIKVNFVHLNQNIQILKLQHGYVVKEGGWGLAFNLIMLNTMSNLST
jgi:hypothetical protein